MKSTTRRGLLGLATITLVGAVWGVYLVRFRGGPTPAAPAAKAWDEAARRAYLDQKLKVSLEVGPELREGDGAPVGGLLRAKGEIQNLGDHRVERLVVVVLPLNVDGEVVSEQQSEVLAGRPLAPGQTRAFDFLIAKRPNYGDRFEHRLR